MTPVLGSVLELHRAWAWVVIVANGLAGLWVLAAGRWRALRTRALWWFVIAAESAVIVQVALGVTMVWSQGLSAPFFHYFYGTIATVTIALLALYRRRVRRRYLLYGLGGLFLMGLGIRALLVVMLKG